MTTERQRPERPTGERILDAAEQLVQLRGFNGFSYADVAAELKITKASLHYHYPSKGALGEALIRRYTQRFVAELVGIDAGSGDASAKLRAYADLYAGVVDGQRMCLCGMLAAEYSTLPEPMRDAVVDFFDQNEAWLARVLRTGKRQNSLSFSGSARDVAQAIISTLEGALLTSRPYANPVRFRTTSRRLIATLTRERVH
jgi:TetR/AcrR family transcriptional repressor of nem operon